MSTLTVIAAAMIAAAAGPEPAEDRCSAPAIVVQAVSPSFPDLPWRAKIGGVQVVEVSIDDAGAVIGTAIASEPKPNLGFDVAAIAAAKQWRFDARPGCSGRKAALTFRFAKPGSPERPAFTSFFPPFELEVVVPARTIEVESRDSAATSAATEIVTISKESGGPAPAIRFITFGADGSVRYGSPGEQGDCGGLAPADLSTVRDVLQSNSELLEMLAAVDYTERIHDSATIAILFPPGSRPTHLRDICIPVELIPVHLLPLLRTFDRLGSAKCGARYELMVPAAR